MGGAHDSHVLQSSLDKFIEKYVLCPNCMLPEIDLRFKQDTLSAKCKACGWSGRTDNSHKIVAFLVRNPIDCHGTIIESIQPTSQDKKARRAERIAAQQKEVKEGQEGQEGREEQEGQEGQKDKKDKKDKKDHKREEHGGKHGKRETKEKKDKEDVKGKKENKDKNAKADGGSKDEKLSKASSDAVQDDFGFDDNEITATLSSLIDFVDSKGGNPTRDDFFQEVRALQLAKAFDHKMRLYVVLRVIFRCSVDAKRLADQSKLLDKFITNCKMETIDVLWAFDKYFEASKNELNASSCFPFVLKVLYDEDWCTEEGILSYYNNDEGAGEPGFETAKASAKPFLAWLAQDEAESDSEADGSEEQQRD